MLDVVSISRHKFRPGTELEATTQGLIDLRVRESLFLSIPCCDTLDIFQ